MGKKFEPIPREILEEMFFEKNMTYHAIAEELSVTLSKVRTSLKKYGFRKTKEQIADLARKGTLNFIKKQNREKFGDENGPFAPGELEYLFLEKNMTRVEIAAMKNVSVDHIQYLLGKANIHKPVEKTIEAGIKTCEKRYGAKRVTQTPEGKKRLLEIFQERFGGNSAMSSPDIVKKRAENNLRKYGATTPQKGDPELRKRMSLSQRKRMAAKVFYPEVNEALFDRDKFIGILKTLPKVTLPTIADKFGCGSTTAKNLLIRHNCLEMLEPAHCDTLPEFEIKNFLKKQGINGEKTKRILQYKNEKGNTASYEIDVYCPDYKIGIEFDGVYWHSAKRKPHLFHMKKCKLAEQKGVFLFHVYEFEWREDKQSIFTQLKALFDNKIIIDDEEFSIHKTGIDFTVCAKGEKVYSFCIFVPKEKDVLIVKNLRIYSRFREKRPFFFFEKIANERRCKKIIVEADYGKIPSSVFENTGFVFVKYKSPENYFVDDKFDWVSDTQLEFVNDPEDIDGANLFVDGIRVEGSGFKIYEKILK